MVFLCTLFSFSTNYGLCMDAMTEFIVRSTLFMAVFLLIAFYLFKHIDKIKKLHGTPDNNANTMAILKHFFRVSK